MALDRCPVCVGRKKLMGLGGIVKDCYQCHGIGYVVIKDDVVCDPVVKRKKSQKQE